MRMVSITALLLVAGLSVTVTMPDGFAYAQEMRLRTVTMEVDNMTCIMCPIWIRKALMKVPGVVKAEVSLEKKTAVVIFDPFRTDISDLSDVMLDMGYPSKIKQ